MNLGDLESELLSPLQTTYEFTYIRVKHQMTSTKLQINLNEQNSNYSIVEERSRFGHLDYCYLEFIWDLGFVIWSSNRTYVPH